MGGVHSGSEEAESQKPGSVVMRKVSSRAQFIISHRLEDDLFSLCMTELCNSTLLHPLYFFFHPLMNWSEADILPLERSFYVVSA